jgi:hypothetical protein
MIAIDCVFSVLTRKAVTMPKSPESLVGLSLEWTGVHHSPGGDFGELSTHTLTYETETTAYATASGKLVGESTYA